MSTGTNGHKRKKVAVMFGGRSVEHEISVITGLQLIKALDPIRWDPYPVYIAPSGKWYFGKKLLDKGFYLRMPGSLSEVTEVTLLPKPGVGGLTILDHPEDHASPVIPIDIFLPAFHGTYGEDGSIQGLFELADVTYTGCGVLGSILGMSKYHSKKIVEAHGVPVLPSQVVNRESVEADFGKHLTSLRDQIIKRLGNFPLFVKPCNLGSSIGVVRATCEEELDSALLHALKYDVAAMVEPCLDKKLEINVSVLDDPLEPIASVVEIPVSSTGKELTYEDKYLRGGSKKGDDSMQGMAALTRVIDPEDLDPAVKEKARSYAVTAFKALNASGVSRIDFMLDTTDGTLYFNEINTIPGSFSFYLWMNSKPPVFYTELLNRIISVAQTKAVRKSSVERQVGFKALKK